MSHTSLSASDNNSGSSSPLTTRATQSAFAKFSGTLVLALGALLVTGCGGDKDSGKAAGSGAGQSAHAAHQHPAAQGAQGAARANANPNAFIVPASGEITISTDDRMRFDITEFVVSPGQTIHLTLSHTGRMPVNTMGHNIAILKMYTSLSTFAQAAARSASTEYIPRSMSTQVIAHTKMLGGGQSDTITFTAPEQTGEYDFLCTFPAHFTAGMKGKMIVRR